MALLEVALNKLLVKEERGGAEKRLTLKDPNSLFSVKCIEHNYGASQDTCTVTLFVCIRYMRGFGLERSCWDQHGTAASWEQTFFDCNENKTVGGVCESGG